MASDNDPEIEAIKRKKIVELQRFAAAKTLLTNIKHPIVLTDSNFTDETSKFPVMLVDFWAPWCAPCRIVSPVIEQLANEYAGSVVFGKLNVDDNPLTATSLQIQSIPTMMIFKNGKVVELLVGALPKSQVQMILRQHLTRARQSTENMYS